MNLKNTISLLAFALCCSALASTPALAKEVSRNVSNSSSNNVEAAPCAKEKFRGKNAKARIQACIDELQKKKPAQEQQQREQIEAWRIELREHCAQNPRSCESRTAELEEKIRANWRDQKNDGHSVE